MISLFTNIYNRLFDSPTYKILIIGMDGAGKTVLYIFHFIRHC